MKINQRRTRFCSVALLCLGMTICHAYSQSSATSISFQGALNGTNGQPLPNGSYPLEFQFWDHPTATAPSNRVGGAVTVPGVEVSGGVASTAIPVQPDWFNGQTRYLGITIQGVNAGPELLPLLPRVLVTAVPYATYSQATRGITVDANGRVGIGTTNTYGTLKLIGNDRGRPALEIAHENPDVGTFQLIPAGIAFPSGALQWGMYFPFAHPGGWASGWDALIYWNGRSLSLGSPNGGRPVFNVGIGTQTPQTDLEVIGTTRTTVLQITSARAAKEQFAPVDAAAVLAKVAALPLATWAYTNSPGIRHLGPVAEDFHAAFALGDSARHIATVDADGVALAAIQGLHQLVTAQQTALRDREAEVHTLWKQLEKLERLVTELYIQRNNTTK